MSFFDHSLPAKITKVSCREKWSILKNSASRRVVLTHTGTNRFIEEGKQNLRSFDATLFCAEYSILYQRDDGSMTSSIIILIISWSFKPQNCTHSAVPQQIVIQPHTWESISLGSIRVIQNLLNVNVKNC